MVEGGPGLAPCHRSCGGEEPAGLLLAPAEGCPCPCWGQPGRPRHHQPHVSAATLSVPSVVSSVLAHRLPGPHPRSCGSITDTGPGSTSTVCCRGLRGRYVTIAVPGREEQLSLCEVEVVEQGCAVLPGGEWAVGTLARGGLGTRHPQPCLSHPRSPERGPGPPSHPVLGAGRRQQCQQRRRWEPGRRLGARVLRPHHGGAGAVVAGGPGPLACCLCRGGEEPP